MNNKNSTYRPTIDLLIVSTQHSAKKEQFCAPEPRSQMLCTVPLRFSSKHQRLPLFWHSVLLEKSPRNKCACAALRNYEKVYYSFPMIHWWLFKTQNVHIYRNFACIITDWGIGSNTSTREALVLLTPDDHHVWQSAEELWPHRRVNLRQCGSRVIWCRSGRQITHQVRCEQLNCFTFCLFLSLI